MSSATSVNDALTAYAAGKLAAEQLIGLVAAEFYRDGRGGVRDALRPVMDVIERAHPGIVELGGSPDAPGFTVKLAERPFPKSYESALRGAVSAVLETHPPSRIPHPAEVRKPGLLRRIVAAIRRVFSASA